MDTERRRSLRPRKAKSAEEIEITISDQEPDSPEPKAKRERSKKSKPSKQKPVEIISQQSLEEIDIYYQMNEKEMKEVNQVFDSNCAPDSDEQLTQDNLKTALRALGFEPSLDEIQHLIERFSNCENKLNRDGFHKIMNLKFGSTVGRKKNDLPGEIAKVFDLMDIDKTGLITIENLQSIAKELNETLTDEELHEMIEEADLDGDQKINQVEFYNIMKRTNLY